ncbi:hypothetical protein F4778DRAFT_409880 [Xylariomycetidae sp. FL2044]|nr:hypothetical protein F4778DRAFT_409880 [Xylariomycetidae sp. FL2044]
MSVATKTSGSWITRRKELHESRRFYKSSRNNRWTIDTGPIVWPQTENTPEGHISREDVEPYLVEGQRHRLVLLHDNPGGFNSNTLITVIRASQWILSIGQLLLLGFRLPKPWEIVLPMVACGITFIWAIPALLWRHIYRKFMSLIEVVIFALFLASFIEMLNIPPFEGAVKESKVALVVIEASALLHLMTCLLYMNPVWHRLMPCLYPRESDKPKEEPYPGDVGVL